VKFSQITKNMSIKLKSLIFNQEKSISKLIDFIFLYRTWTSHVPFSSHLTTSDKLTVTSPTRRANTSTQSPDDVSERVSCTLI